MPKCLQVDGRHRRPYTESDQALVSRQIFGPFGQTDRYDEREDAFKALSKR